MPRGTCISPATGMSRGRTARVGGILAVQRHAADRGAVDDVEIVGPCAVVAADNVKLQRRQHALERVGIGLKRRLAGRDDSLAAHVLAAARAVDRCCSALRRFRECSRPKAASALTARSQSLPRAIFTRPLFAEALDRQMGVARPQARRTTAGCGGPTCPVPRALQSRKRPRPPPAPWPA